jgi:signal transduction histidine kinase
VSDQRLPSTAQVPLIVCLFMMAVSVFASERVLSRLIDSQTREIQALADIYLDGLALALVDAIIREDVWQVFDVLDRSRHGAGEIKPSETVVAGRDDFVIASSDPIRIPSHVRVPAPYSEHPSKNGKIVIAEDANRAYIRREVLYENLRIGSIYAALDIAPLLAERREVLWTLILTNVLLTLALAGAAWLTVARMMRPLRVVTKHLEWSRSGEVAPIPDALLASAKGEHRATYEAFNRLAAAVSEREALSAQLAEEERLASLGRLASGMAHEINNPLGGLFNALDTLKRHGADPGVRSATIELVERGLKGIRDVVSAALMSYRAERDDRPVTSDDIEDLKLLIGPEARRRGVALHWRNDLKGEVAVSAAAVRQIILNLVLNACQATARDTWAALRVAAFAQTMIIEVEDPGPGMPDAAVAMLTGTADRPAPIGAGTGLGLWMTNRLVRELGGSVSVQKRQGGGTQISIRLPVKRETRLSDVA